MEQIQSGIEKSKSEEVKPSESSELIVVSFSSEPNELIVVTVPSGLSELIVRGHGSGHSDHSEGHSEGHSEDGQLRHPYYSSPQNH